MFTFAGPRGILVSGIRNPEAREETMSETSQLNLKIGTRVILPADDELGVQA